MAPTTPARDPKAEKMRKINDKVKEAHLLQKSIEEFLRKINEAEQKNNFTQEYKSLVDEQDSWFSTRNKDKLPELLTPGRKIHANIQPDENLDELISYMDNLLKDLQSILQKIKNYVDTNTPDKSVKRDLDRMKSKLYDLKSQFSDLYTKATVNSQQNVLDILDETLDEQIRIIEDDIETTATTANQKDTVKELQVKLKGLMINLESLAKLSRDKNVKDEDDNEDEDDWAFTGEGADKANDFRERVTDAFQAFRRDMTAEMRKLKAKAQNSYDMSDAEKRNSEITKLKDEIRKAEEKVNSDKVMLDQRQALNETRLGPFERAVAEAERRLSEKEKALERAENKMNQSVFMKPDDFTQGFDQTLMVVRQYQQQLRAALKETEVNTGVALKEDRMKLKQDLKKTFSRQFRDIQEEIVQFANFMSKASAQLRKTKIPDSKLQEVTIIKSMADDNATEIRISIGTVHREILRGIEIEIDGWTKNKGAIVMLYLFKSLRVASSWLAFYLADKLFTEYYNKNKNAAANPKTVDLRWFVAIYASFQLVFDLIAIVVMYFVRRIDPDVVSGALILDYVFDSAVVTLMVLSSSVWVADIIQDKKYFGYRTNGKKAVRALRTIMVWLLVLHSLAPYFYAAGPNFTGRAKAKDLDMAIREAKIKAKADAKAKAS